jgi:RES domain-containing protein
MKPLRDRAREGRANPKGIPYLYLATHAKAAATRKNGKLGGRPSKKKVRVK